MNHHVWKQMVSTLLQNELNKVKWSSQPWSGLINSEIVKSKVKQYKQRWGGLINDEMIWAAVKWYNQKRTRYNKKKN